jgi:T5SS/PEP-CTERM-associated repeat protein
VASSLLGSAGVIGEASTGHGMATVYGGQWETSGQLTVGGAGIGSLEIESVANGITGQVVAWDATIGSLSGSTGTVMLDGGEMLVADGEHAASTLIVGASGNGSLSLGNGSEVAVGVALGANATNNGFLDIGQNASGSGKVRIGGDSRLLVYGDAAVGGSVPVRGAPSPGGTGEVDVGLSQNDVALLAVLGDLTIYGNSKVVLGGAEATVRAGAIDIASGGVISGAGTLSGVGGGNGTVQLASIDNEGTIAASGDLLVYGNVTGNGHLAAEPGQTLTLQAAVALGQFLDFKPRAHVVLNDPMAFAGTITGFSAGDRLDLASINATSLSWTGNVLTLVTTTSAPYQPPQPGDPPLPTGTFSLQFDAAYGGIVLQSDGHGGTNLVMPGGQGDVHMTSFDGLYYDFQAVGDFVAARSPDPANAWQFQIRTASGPGVTSITTELAAAIGDSRVVFAIGGNTLTVDGAPDTLGIGEVQSFEEGNLKHLSAATWQVTWTGGESVTVTDSGACLDWTVALGPNDGPGSVQGLLGSHSGQANDFQLPDGTVLPQPLGEADILGVFADAWRVAPETSLFDSVGGNLLANPRSAGSTDASLAPMIQAIAGLGAPGETVQTTDPHIACDLIAVSAPAPLFHT